MQSEQTTVHTRLIPLTDWNRYHCWPPIGGLRNLMFFREANGFATAFKKVGRRVLIDEAEFFECCNRQANPQKAA